MPRKAPAALMKPLTIAPELEAVIGKGPMPRGQVMKKIWDYIKKAGLQDDKNRRMINCDATLSALCDKEKQISMFDLAKFMSRYISDPSKAKK